MGSKAGGPDYLLQFCDPQVISENTVRQGFASGVGQMGKQGSQTPKQENQTGKQRNQTGSGGPAKRSGSRRQKGTA